MRIRTAYEEPYRVHTELDDEVLTKQSFKKECDINYIMSKYEKTGTISHLRHSEPFYGDFTNVGDYHTALQKINDSRAYFEALPAKVRARFANDVGEFLSFVSDQNNFEEMCELGLAQKVEQKTTKVGSDENNTVTST